MKVKTKLFGEIDLDDNKIIHFEQGMIGFEFLKDFAIIYSDDNKDNHTISWLQSLEEAEIAFPIINPFVVMDDYNPDINDNALVPLGNITNENLSVMVTLTVPEDITQMSCNLKAPIIINTENKRGAQIIAENPEYLIKYKIYELLNERKRTKEGC